MSGRIIVIRRLINLSTLPRYFCFGSKFALSIKQLTNALRQDEKRGESKRKKKQRSDGSIPLKRIKTLDARI